VELNDVQAMDLVQNQLYEVTKIRVLTIIDAFKSSAPVIDEGPFYTRANVAETLERFVLTLAIAVHPHRSEA
jgi:putative transposase